MKDYEKIADLTRKNVILKDMVRDLRNKVLRLQKQITRFKADHRAGEEWEAELRDILGMAPAHVVGSSILTTVSELVGKNKN